MADPVLKTIFTANGQEAEKVIANLERKVEGLEQKYKRLGAATKEGFDKNNLTAFETGLEAVTAKTVAVAGGMALVGTAVRGASAEVVKFNSDLDTAWNKQREMASKWATQEALTPKEIAAQMPAVKLAAMRTPVLDLAGTMEAQRQLASVGIADADVKSGAALNSLLRLRALSQAYGDQAESPEATATSINQLLRATGGGNRAADLERVGAKVAALSADSAISAQSLKQLSQVAGTLTTFGLSETEQLSAYRVGFETQGDAVGATGLKTMVARLGTAGGDKTRTAALAAMGLKPEDVAIAKGGIGIETAMAKLRGGMAGMDENKKNIALQDLFGSEGLATASVLLSDSGFERYRAGLRTAGNAEQAGADRIRIFQESREATIRRADIEKESALYDAAQRGATWGEYGRLEDARKTRAMADAQGAGGRMLQGYANWVEGVGDWFHQSTGHTPESMMRQSQGSMIPQVQTDQMRELERQTKLLERIADGQEQKPINRNGQVE